MRWWWMTVRFVGSCAGAIDRYASVSSAMTKIRSMSRSLAPPSRRGGFGAVLTA
jgi:hypothetical protein